MVIALKLESRIAEIQSASSDLVSSLSVYWIHSIRVVQALGGVSHSFPHVGSPLIDGHLVVFPWVDPGLAEQTMKVGYVDVHEPACTLNNVDESL